MDDIVMMTLKVLKKSAKMQTYQGKSGTISYFNIIGGNYQEVVLLKNYQSHKYQMMQQGMTYKFHNLIRKPDALWVVSSTSVGYSKTVEVADNITIPQLPEDESPTGRKRSLTEALCSPTSYKSNVKANIIKVCRVKFVQENQLAVRCLGLKDESGYAKVALFSNIAEQTYMTGKVVELTGLYRKDYMKKSQLTMSRATSCQFLSDDEIGVTVNDEDEQHFLRDGDFSIPDAQQNQRFELDSIYEVCLYECCKNPACHKKKIRDGICPTCQGQDSQWTCRVKVSIISYEAPKQKDMTIFQGDFEKLFGKLQNLSNEQEILEQVLESLPVVFTAKLAGNNLYNIQKF